MISLKNHIIFFSGGKSSFTVAHLVKQQFPNDNILLYFTDTLWEDEDLYRFIYEASAKLELPLLYHAVGLNPLQVIVLERFMANSRVGLCSQRLKMEPAANWLYENKDPKEVRWYDRDLLKADIIPCSEGFKENTTLYFGIGWDEAQREPKIKKNWKGFKVKMPLMEEVIDNNEVLKLYDIEEPALYKKGFVHNNCKGRCVKAGQAHFKNLYEQDRKTYIELMEYEAVLSEYIRYTKQPHVKSGKQKDYLFDDVWEYVTSGKRSAKIEKILQSSMILKNRLFGFEPKKNASRKEPYTFISKQKNKVKFSYPLHALRDDILIESPEVDEYDFGGCGCFVDDDRNDSCDLTALLKERQKETAAPTKQPSVVGEKEAAPIKTLSIDIETYSSTDLKKGGVYKYVEAEDFEILIFAYSVDGDPTETNELAMGEEIPYNIQCALTDPKVQKRAWNAQFERIALSEYLRRKYLEIASYSEGFTENGYLDPSQWRCTMVDAMRAGLPATLKQAALALKLDVLKDEAGTALINYFSKPRKPTKLRQETRNLPHDDMEKWDAFVSYCRQDVEVEKAVGDAVEPYLYVGNKADRFEMALYHLDQNINDRGILLDEKLVDGAQAVDAAYKAQLMDIAQKITGLSNPNSAAQLQKWFAEQGLELPNMQAETIKKALKDASGIVKQMLEIRQDLSKTSVKKYQAMQNAICRDGRVHGLLQFYGANRTGRWAGRLVQVQNLTKHKVNDHDLQVARQLLREQDLDSIEMLFDSASDILSQLVRTSFVAPEGSTFAVSDFSAIEARVIAWLGGEKWRLEVFNTHGKIYEASAAQMFKVPIETIDKGSPLRQKGKVAELALGYQGGAGALISMGALDMGLAENELPELVQAWRKANPNIVSLWHGIERAALRAVESGEIVDFEKGIQFFMHKGTLMMRLPSGRCLCYYGARVRDHQKFAGKQEIVYWGVGDSRKWMLLSTYGGKLTENAVQAIARDCLAMTLLRLEKEGYLTVMHVHDEVVMESAENTITTIEEIMARPISWAQGLPLEADGFESPFYKKD